MPWRRKGIWGRETYYAFYDAFVVEEVICFYLLERIVY